MVVVLTWSFGGFAALCTAWAGIAAYSGPEDMIDDDRFWHGVEFWTYVGGAILFACLWKWFSA
jgi:hypothetical protein